MANNTNTGSERQYYIDWLRIMLIISVFLFHTGMIFNTWDWHVKNDILYGGVLRKVMIFLHNWRMPLLFMLSGAGTFFALGNKTTGQYLLERTRRLLIPFFAGIFLLVPVQVYVEKISDYTSIIDFYRHMFDGIYPEGNFSWHHLWFILYLFVIALLVSTVPELPQKQKVQDTGCPHGGRSLQPLRTEYRDHTTAALTDHTAEIF